MRVWLRHKRFGIGLVGVVLLAGCSSEPRADRRRRRRPRRPRPPPRRPRGWRRSPSRYPRTWRRPHSTNRDRRWCRRAGRSRCGPGSPAPGWRRGPRTARCWYRCRARGQVVRLAAQWCRAARIGAARRAGPAARPGVRRVHALCRRERPGRRLRLRQRSGDQPAHRRRRAARRQKPRPARRLLARAEERRRRTRRRRLLLDRFHRQHLRRGPRRRIPRGRPSCASRPAEDRPGRSPPASATAPGLAVAPDGSVWTAVNNRDNIGYPEPGTSYGRVDPGLRRRPSARVRRPADAGARIGLALLQSRRRTGRTCPSSATSRPTPTAASSTARRCRRSSRASARTPRRWG